MKKLILILMLCCLVGCGSKEWVTSHPLVYNYDDIWNTSYQVIAKRYNIERASKEERTLETEWRKNMSMHYLDSMQDKVYLKIEDYEPKDIERNLNIEIDLNEKKTDKKKYLLKIAVEREQNRNIDNPNIASQAKWYPIADDIEEARLILNFILTKLDLLPRLEVERQELKNKKNNRKQKGELQK